MRDNNDCVCYDQDGNVIRVIVARKRTSSKANKLANQKSLYRLQEIELARRKRRRMGK